MVWPFTKRASKLGSQHPQDPVLATWFGGGNVTSSGAAVTLTTATRITTVDACINVLAQTMASMPLKVYRLTKDGKEPDPNHPLWPLLHNAPNKIQTSFEWRETATAHTALRGASYNFIVQRNDGSIEELRPLNPDAVTPFMAPDFTIAYRYFPPGGKQQILLDSEVLRIPAISDDGIIPQSTLTKHRETFGVSLSSQEYLARFFSNSAAPKGALTIPATVGPEAVKLLRESWEERHKGAHNANKLAILDGGMEWQSIGMSNDDAQYLEIAQFQVADIARIYRVPPHMVGDLTRSTFSNIEHQTIDFANYTILPWTRRWEDRLNRSLLTEAGRKTHFIGFEMKGLMRGDSKARSEFYKKLFNLSAMTANDILRAEDMPTYEGGDVHYVMQNMAPVEILAKLLAAKLTAPAGPTNGTGLPFNDVGDEDADEDDDENGDTIQ